MSTRDYAKSSHPLFQYQLIVLNSASLLYNDKYCRIRFNYFKEEYMPESSKEEKTAPRRRTRLFIIIIIAVIGFLGLGYLGGYFFLPGTIESAYEGRDCESVLSRNDIYSVIYPFASMDKSHGGQVRECAIYMLAVANERAESWQDSYNAFSVYSETYPKGLFIDDTHQHGAVALMGLVKEDVGKENYSKANSGLDFILTNYGDTPTAADAEKLKSSLRMGLGVDLRENGDFAGAEQIFKEINAQAQENGQNEGARASQLELAQTYLTWGLDLQSQEKFAEAKAKFDIAVSTDPDPSSVSGPATQAKASQPDLYTQWGDYLIGQKDFANAMERYRTAASLSEDQSEANDLIANGYVQWAMESINEDDFLGALVLLDFAQESNSTDATNTLVDDTRSDLYLAFSQSDGEQARQAIDDAIRIVCEHHTQPRLPIFGLDEENIRAGVDRAEEPLPDSLAATTPASLHYAACVEEDTKVVGTLTLPISTTLFGGPPGVVQITYANFQYIWNVVLRKVDTGEVVEESVIEGEEPAPLVDYNIDFSTYNYFGAKPDVADLADWIVSVID